MFNDSNKPSDKQIILNLNLITDRLNADIKKLTEENESFKNQILELTKELLDIKSEMKIILYQKENNSNASLDSTASSVVTVIPKKRLPRYSTVHLERSLEVLQNIRKIKLDHETKKELEKKLETDHKV